MMTLDPGRASDDATEQAATLRRSGIVTTEMLEAPDRRLFLWIGGLEAFSQLLGFIGASKLPGVVLPLLQQSLLIWQVTLAYLVLNKRLDSVQVRVELCHKATLMTEASACCSIMALFIAQSQSGRLSRCAGTVAP